MGDETPDFLAANAAFRRSEFACAAELFTRALEQRPADERVHSNRSAALLRLGELDAAEADARRCVELAPRWHKAHFRLGKVHLARGRLLAAWEAFYAAHALDSAAPLYAHMLAAVEERIDGEGAPESARDGLRALKLRVAKVDPMAALTRRPAREPLPVTVLSGFLGAGKTSVLQHVLSHAPRGLRLAVLVNDMAALNVDAALVRDGRAALARSREEALVELSNGCICCTLREDLLAQVAELALADRFDALLIESSGISEPMPVAQTFLFEDGLGRSLAHLARIDTMATVLDAANFAANHGSADSLRARSLGATPSDGRLLAELLLEQAEFADLLLLNKADLVPAEGLAAVRACAAALNPRAEIVECVHGALDPSLLLGARRFNLDDAQRARGWGTELLGADEHTPESEAFGIASVVYRRERPFDAHRLHALLAARAQPSHPLSGARVVRSKGFCWVAQAPRWRLHWSGAGGAAVRLEVSGPWLSALARDVGADEALLRELAAREGWEGRAHAERAVELVLIGTQLERAPIEAALDGALATDAELAAAARAATAGAGAEGGAEAREHPFSAMLAGHAREYERALAAGKADPSAAAPEPAALQAAPADAPAEAEPLAARRPWSKPSVEAMLRERLDELAARAAAAGAKSHTPPEPGGSAPAADACTAHAPAADVTARAAPSEQCAAHVASSSRDARDTAATECRVAHTAAAITTSRKRPAEGSIA